MTLEETFREYASAFDGRPKNFYEVNDLFEALYHDDFVYDVNGHLLNKERLRHIDSNLLALGSKIIVISFEEFDGTVQFKTRVINDSGDFEIHSVVSLTEGKLWRSRPAPNSVESLSKLISLSNILDVKSKIRLLLDDLNENIYDFEDVSQSFEDLHHDDFVHEMDGTNPLKKTQWKNLIKILYSCRTRFSDIKINFLESGLIDIKFHVVNNKINVFCHTVGRIQGTKLIRISPSDEESKRAHSKLLILGLRYSKQHDFQVHSLPEEKPRYSPVVESE